MAEEKKKITFGNIGNALKSVATDHITTVAGDVFDEERQQYQGEINGIVGSYIENQEFIHVHTDSEGKLLWWIKKDGTVGWSKGVPTPIQEELKKLEQLIKDNTEGDESVVGRVAARVAALEVAITKKVDGEYIENPEFIHVLTDSEGRVLWGLLSSGKVVYGAGIPDQIATIVEEIYDTFGRYVDNPEFIEVKCDNAGRLIYAVLTDGDFKFGKMPSQITELVNKLK